MKNIFFHKNTLLLIIIFSCIVFPKINPCSICDLPLEQSFSIDVWGNQFHTYHEAEGIFCYSCSRIISQKITNGGYIFEDGRHLCSLCNVSAIHKSSDIKNSFDSVLEQLKLVGITGLSNKIPINLLNMHNLNNLNNFSHSNTKGYTEIVLTNDKKIHYASISILSGLPKIEFEAILAHELLHIWIKKNNINLDSKKEEGFCNLGSYLIYKNHNTKISKIHLQSMENNNDPIYGLEYRKIKKTLKNRGWENLIKSLLN